MFDLKRTVLCLCVTAVALPGMSAPAGARNSSGLDTSIQISAPTQRANLNAEADPPEADFPVMPASTTRMRTYVGGYGHSVFLVPGGGVLLAGTYGAGGYNCCQPWLVRLDSFGTPLWHLTYEAEGLAGANNMQPTSDGGYIMAGEGVDMLAVKIGDDGVVEWSKNYGSGIGPRSRVFLTAEGDYLLLGGTSLLDDGTHSNARVLRLDQDGNILWQKVFGEYGVSEYFTSATIAHNGNMVIAGMNAGDYWILEMDRLGNVVWEKTYGGYWEDDAWSITRLRDRYYIVVGSSDTYAAGGMRNWWVLLLSETGQILDQRSYGGPDSEDPNIVIETSDGGWMIGGGTGSFGAGGSDIWLIKFDSSGNIQWQKTYGGYRTDHAWHIQERPSGGYVVVGDSYLYPDTYDFWLMTIDENGYVRNGDCGEVNKTIVTPIETNATVRSPSTTVHDTNIEAANLRVAVVDQTGSIEDCPFGE